MTPNNAHNIIQSIKATCDPDVIAKGLCVYVVSTSPILIIWYIA